VKVPFIDLKPLAALVSKSVVWTWREQIENTEFVGGPRVFSLEHRVGELLGVEHVVACGNGTDALRIALQALGIGPGKKVALPNLTFWATYEAVAQLGATPVLIEIDATDLQMDLDEFRRAYQKVGFDAAILVHLMGWASRRVGEFRSFCQDKGIPLLEDGAQSWGVEVDGRSVYAAAQASTLSFYPAKVIGGCMDGGAVLTGDAGLAALVRKLCNHGRASHYSYSYAGWNSRMGGLHAAWLLAMLEHAGTILAARRTLAAAYQRLFEELADELVGYHAPPGVVGNGYLAVCTLRRRDLATVTARLNEAGIDCGRVYPETLDAQPPAAHALRTGNLEKSRAFCQSVLNPPLYYGMSQEQMAYVETTLRRVLREPA
jgi:dTDP-4-amino-4,6-dideoxygalactose transaminase